MSRAILVAVAVLGCVACSLMQLDELELRSCREDTDCFALSRDATDGLRACFRCNSGRCEPSDSMVEKSLESVGALGWLKSTTAMPGRTLVALGVADRSQAARGIMIGEDGRRQLSAIGFAGESAKMTLEALSLDRFGSNHLIAVALDVTRCADGLIRVGVSTRDEPFSLRAAGELTVYASGVAVDRASGCTGVGRPLGARAPVIATLEEKAHPAEALAIWVATSQQGAGLPERCPSLGEATAPIEGLRLSLSETGDTASFKAVADPRPVELAANARVSSSPQLVAFRRPARLGYLIAYVEPRGVRLLPVGRADDVSATSVLVEDPDANQVALSVGASTGDTQLVLVVWTSGCGEESRLRGVVYGWSERGLAPIQASFLLRDGESIVGAPAAAHVESGYATVGPGGAWTVVWTEDSGGSTSVRASLVFDDTSKPEPSVPLFRGDAMFPFVHKADRSPFAYGFASMLDDEHGDVTIMACD